MRTLHVGRPNIGNREALHMRIDKILDNKRFTNNGPMVREFEERLKGYTGAKHVIAMCNGTIAMEILIKALGLKGDSG